jgi:hypothetical protein
MFWQNVNAHRHTPFTDGDIRFIGRVTIALTPSHIHGRGKSADETIGARNDEGIVRIRNRGRYGGADRGNLGHVGAWRLGR